MRLFPGDDVPELAAIAQDMALPWLMPLGLSRAHRDRLGNLLVRALRGFDPFLRGMQIRWAEAASLREGRLSLPEHVLVWWRSTVPAEAAEVLREAPRLTSGLHLIDVDGDPGATALEWLLPFKERLRLELIEALRERFSAPEAEQLSKTLNEAAERLLSPIDLLDFTEHLLEAWSAGSSPTDARAEAIAGVLTGQVAWTTSDLRTAEAWNTAFEREAMPTPLPPVSTMLTARGLLEGDRGRVPAVLAWLAEPGAQERVMRRIQQHVKDAARGLSPAERVAAVVEGDLRAWLDNRPQEGPLPKATVNRVAEHVRAVMSSQFPSHFILDVATAPAAHRVSLSLLDEAGGLLETHAVVLPESPAACWSAWFNPASRESIDFHALHLATMGDILGQQVLGPAIARRLAEGMHPRTLLIRLPDPNQDALAATLARLPWELARAPGDTHTLLDRHLRVRLTPWGATPGRSSMVTPAPGEPVRALLVFARASGSIAERLERDRLLSMFFEHILPFHHVEVDTLEHGVSVRRLREQARRGYHVVYWSGSNCQDALEVAPDAGEAPCLPIPSLVRLFPFTPPVFFLASAAPDAGLTAVAWSLASAGVRQVVAMRNGTEERYGRRLARRFFRALWAPPAGHPVDTALSLACQELVWDSARAEDYRLRDHASAVVFGEESITLPPALQRSDQMDRRAPVPQPLLQDGSKDLDPVPNFVGREEALAELERRWLSPGGSAVAMIQGLAGLGKTCLAAEVIRLWFHQFNCVLCFQAKGTALSTAAFYRRLDQQLTLASPVYRQRCHPNEMARVFLPPTPGITDPEEALQDNLLAILDSERILLVLDGFDANLQASGDSQDPAWDGLLAKLGDRLQTTGSRVLITTRHKVKTLEEHALWVALGPLPEPEAKLFLEGEPALQKALVGAKDGPGLAQRILDVSRGHPLILERLAARAQTLETSHEARSALAGVLDKIQEQGYVVVPEVLGKTPKERHLLREAMMGAVDLLLRRLLPEARRLLWRMSRASEPISTSMLESVWLHEAPTLLGKLLASGLLVREGETYTVHPLVRERVDTSMAEASTEHTGQTEVDVWRAYGEWHANTFKAQIAKGESADTVELGLRGIRYFARARAFGSLGPLAAELVNQVHAPALLEQVIGELRELARDVPPGRRRWHLQATLADALWKVGQPAEALPYYQQAAAEAEAAEQWSDVSRLCWNQANALDALRYPEQAREMYQRSAEAQQRAGRPRIDSLGGELEALRIEVNQGHAADVLPGIEARLNEVRGWWERRQRGKPMAEVPDVNALARVLISGLDVARRANRALERWQPCLDLLEEMEQAYRALGIGEHDQARTRFNRYRPLMKLGKLTEAQTVLEGCLEVFHRVGAMTDEAGALSALAEVHHLHGEPAQALAMERRALELRNNLNDPEDRAISHHNMAVYLHAASVPDEAGAHQLADLAYRLAAGLDLDDSLRNLVVDIRQALKQGKRFALLRLVELLSDPASTPLQRFLVEENVSLEALQARLDDLLTEARVTAVAEGSGTRARTPTL